MKKLAVVLAICIAGLLASFTRNKGADRPFAAKAGTKAHLGEQLFFEPMLSADGKISCASCHIPTHGFADTAAISTGIHGRKGTRNTPSCTNLAERPYFFYDGRAATMEDQVKFPIENKDEMGLPIQDAVKRLRASKKYIQLFKQTFGTAPNDTNLKTALVAYITTLETSRTPFDRFMDDDSTAISASAQRGRDLFMGSKAKCFDCHFSPDFTGDEFRNIGLFDGGKLNDSGRYIISRDSRDIGKFKVPGLRNVGVTAPYMHNGMFKTLREVIEYYDDPYIKVSRPVNIDTLMLKPLGLSAGEKADLENFLLTLTDDRFNQ